MQNKKLKICLLLGIIFLLKLSPVFSNLNVLSKITSFSFGGFEKPFGSLQSITFNEVTNQFIVLDEIKKSIYTYNSFFLPISEYYLKDSEKPLQIAASKKGNIFILDNQKKIIIYSNNLKYLKTLELTKISNNKDIIISSFALDLKENIYLAEQTKKNIVVINTLEEILQQFGEEGQGKGKFTNLQDLYIDGQGNLFVLDNANTEAVIQVFQQNGIFKYSFGHLGNSVNDFSHPVAITGNRRGEILIADDVLNEIKIFTNSGTLLQTLKDNPENFASQNDFYIFSPQDLVVDSFNKVYVLEKNRNRLLVLSY